MSDALGGLVNIALVAFFALIIVGYMAFNINYSKAYRAKTYIVNAFETYGSECTNENGTCHDVIVEYMKTIGYASTDISRDKAKEIACGDKSNCDLRCSSAGYCWVKFGDNDSNGTNYYKIVTKITIEVPVIQNVTGMINVFYVSGSTGNMKN